MTDQTVTIAGRTFRIGAWYGPAKPVADNAMAHAKARKFQTIVGWSTRRPKVSYVFKTDNGKWDTGRCSAAQWFQWAGEEVLDA